MKKLRTACGAFSILVYILVDCGIELFDELIVAGFYSVSYAVLKMILENDTCRAAKRRAHRRKLDKNIRAITLVLDHALYGFEMPDSAREPVYNGLALRVRMRMVVVRMLVLGMLRDVLAGFIIVAVDNSVAVVMVKAVVRSVH